MIEKIDLYREVLAIEPNSKVFFPLARELAEAGRVDEAIRIL
ncbi:MAG: tetratricopeptide repeat protein, partial [Desulfovibrio sp.]|nr:tetratricopeptide repeat protein [Desulfovibrio sp.]